MRFNLFTVYQNSTVSPLVSVFSRLSLITIIMATLLFMVQPTDAEGQITTAGVGETLYATDVKMGNANGKQCAIYDNETLHVVMDRICELCHNMFSHENPNTRAHCRSDCFRTEQFKRCLLLFRPARTQRHVTFRRIPVSIAFEN